jgi:transposase
MREECSMSQGKKTRRARRKFTREFKADVVKLCRTGSESIRDVAERLDLTETAVRAWVKQAEVDEQGGTADALTTDEKAELTRLRRENKRLTMERDILKKATAFFAKENS